MLILIFKGLCTGHTVIQFCTMTLANKTCNSLPGWLRKGKFMSFKYTEQHSFVMQDHNFCKLRTVQYFITIAANTLQWWIPTFPPWSVFLRVLNENGTFASSLMVRITISLSVIECSASIIVRRTLYEITLILWLLNFGIRRCLVCVRGKYRIIEQMQGLIWTEVSFLILYLPPYTLFLNLMMQFFLLTHSTCPISNSIFLYRNVLLTWKTLRTLQIFVQ